MATWLRITLAWAALAAWVASSGVSADLLQVFAYVNMTASHVQKMSTPEAVAQAMQDEPCQFCRAAAAARQAATSQAPLAKNEAIKVKVNGWLWSQDASLLREHTFSVLHEAAPLLLVSELVHEVPTPPPKV